jgi:hypothetical protein
VLGSLDKIQLGQGPSVGAVWTLYTTARRLGLDRAMGPSFAGRLALWQVLARVLDQGSRLSAVRLAQVHAACDVLGLRRGFDENDLYANLGWRSQQPPAIEQRLFAARRGAEKPELFLYDVTSSYLEGEQNAYGDYGYPRDGNKGKKQIVIGLLCGQQGEPVSTEVFRGNTQDPKTFAAQVQTASQPAITRPPMESLLEARVLLMDLFDAAVCEVQHEGLRYVLRRNPLRAAQLAASRADKQARLELLLRSSGTAIWPSIPAPRWPPRRRRCAPRLPN